MERAAVPEVIAVARNSGLRLLREDGWLKVREGITTPDEVVMCTEAGAAVCGSMSNLFVCLSGEWLTPPVTQCGVAGVMRALVMAFAPRAGLSVRVATVTEAQLTTSTSMFVTNVRLGMQPVHWYEGRSLVLDERGARVQELIDGTP